MASDKLEMRAYKLEHDAACLERLPAGERSDFTASVARAFRATSRDIRDAAAEIARLTRELEEAREAASDARKEAVRLAVEQRDAAAENIRLAAELAEMRRLYADMTLEQGRFRGELEEARARERRLREAHERSVGVFRRACEIAEAAILAGETPETASARLRNAIEADIAEINALVALATPQEASGAD